MATKVIEVPSKFQQKAQDWTKPAAMAIPKEGYFKEERGRYGPVFPRTPACYGFSVVGKIKPGREQAFRNYAQKIEAAVKGDPSVLAPLKLHYLRWVMFDIGSGLHFIDPNFHELGNERYAPPKYSRKDTHVLKTS